MSATEVNLRSRSDAQPAEQIFSVGKEFHDPEDGLPQIGHSDDIAVHFAITDVSSTEGYQQVDEHVKYAHVVMFEYPNWDKRSSTFRQLVKRAELVKTPDERIKVFTQLQKKSPKGFETAFAVGVGESACRLIRNEFQEEKYRDLLAKRDKSQVVLRASEFAQGSVDDALQVLDTSLDALYRLQFNGAALRALMIAGRLAVEFPKEADEDTSVADQENHQDVTVIIPHNLMATPSLYRKIAGHAMGENGTATYHNQQLPVDPISEMHMLRQYYVGAEAIPRALRLRALVQIIHNEFIRRKLIPASKEAKQKKQPRFAEDDALIGYMLGGIPEDDLEELTAHPFTRSNTDRLRGVLQKNNMLLSPKETEQVFKEYRNATLPKAWDES